MLNKNEIKLYDEKNGRTMRRLVVSRNGYVPPVHDWHYQEVIITDELRNGLPTIKLKGERSPTQIIREDDYVIERITEEKSTRYEFHHYYGGRLRSLSLANNLDVYTKLVTGKREIQKWLDSGKCPELSVWVHKTFPNQSFNFPDALRGILTALRQLIPGELLRDSEAINLDNLILSTHKFYRMLTKKTPELKHSQVTGTINPDDFVATQDDPHGNYARSVGFRTNSIFIEISKDGRHSKVINKLPEPGARIVEIKVIGWVLFELSYKPIYDLKSFIYQPT